MIEKKTVVGVPWSDEEQAIIREHYPSGGADACMALLPNRKRTAIQSRAHLLGVHHTASKFSQQWANRQVESETAWKIPADDRPDAERTLDRLLARLRCPFTPSPMFGVPMVGA